MKYHSLKLSLALLSLSAFMAACGDAPGGGGSAGISAIKVPTIQEVKAWRLENVDKRIYNVKSYEVSDLSCSEVAKEEMDTVKRSYEAFGKSAEHLLKSLVQCSYTVNAFLETRDKEYSMMKDMTITNHMVKNEKFGLLSNDQQTKTKWVGTPRLPRSQP